MIVNPIIGLLTGVFKVTGLPFSLNSTTGQAPYPVFGQVRLGLSAPRFGADDSADTSKPADNDAANTPEDTFTPKAETDKASAEHQSVDSTAAAEDVEATQAPSEVFPSDQPEKPSRKYWIKSGIMSALSMAALGGMILAASSRVGVIAGTAVFLAGLLLYDFTTDFSRAKGLTNISDLDYIKNVITGHAERPLKMIAKIWHPSNPEKQAAFVNKHLHRINNFNPHALLGVTGLDSEKAINDIKSQDSFAAKALVAGRFMVALILHKVLRKFIKGRGGIALNLATAAFGVATGNKYGKLDDAATQPPTPIKPFGTTPPKSATA